MNDANKPGTNVDSQLDELRKQAYKQKDPYGTTIEGAMSTKDLALPVGRKVSMEVIEGPKKGVVYVFPKGNVVIGRSSDADLCVEDDKISRKHCLIETFARDLVFISDLASTNGTHINGMRIRSTKLKDGDRIQMGKTTLLFHLLDEESS
jgi:hypothetical protein